MVYTPAIISSTESSTNPNPRAPMILTPHFLSGMRTISEPIGLRKAHHFGTGSAPVRIAAITVTARRARVPHQPGTLVD